MAQNFDLTQTGPELQERVNQVFPNRDAIEQETATREAQDESLETSLKEYTDAEQTRAEAAEGALDTRVSANEVDIDLLKSQYEALTQSDIIVGPLPSTGQPNKIYRVPGSTYYTDYMWANGGWVKLAEYSTLDGYVYKGIATPSGTPVQAGEAVFYFAVQPGTYTNYGGLVVTNTIAILKYNGTEWTKDDVITIDAEPTAGSDNLVTSGAVAASVVYDISAANAVGGQLATYADLAAALNGGANVPVDVRKGGMEIKFVQSSDNKYVQYCCLSDEFSTKVADWQCINASIKFLPNYSYVTRYSKVLIDENKRIIIGEEKSKTIDVLRKDISKNYLKNPSIFEYVTRYKSVVLSEDGRMLYYDYKDKTVTADIQQVNQEIHPRLYSIIQALSRSICADYIFDEPSEFEVPNDEYIYGIFDKNGAYVSGFSKNINNN